MSFPLVARGRQGASDIPLHTRIGSAISEAQPTDSPIDAFIKMWPKLEVDYALMVHTLIKYCEDQLHKKEIGCDVSGRTKKVDSIRKSAARRETHGDKRYLRVEEVFSNVHDLAGIRIVVEVPSSIEIVTTFIQDTFQKAGEPSKFTSDRKISDDWAPWFGAYQATNHRAKVKLNTAGVLSPYQDVLFEIQLTTLSEQLYNKAAHDWIYKKSHGPLTRRDEILIDMLHGAALIYSLGMVYLQDGEEKSVDVELIDGIKEAYSKDDPETLVKMLPDHLRLGQNNQTINDQFSGKPIPFELVAKAMASPASRVAEPYLLESIVKYIEENMQPPIQLPTFEDARFDSARVHDAPKCYEGTRASVFDRVMAWVNDAEGETFFWLHSPAGTGKSTLARSLVAKLLDTKQLAAGYFFQRQDVVGSGTSLFFPTIASQFMDTIPEYDVFLRKSLKDAKNPKVESKPLEDQFKILIQHPLSEMDGPKITRVIIVDALDECNAPDHLYRILRRDKNGIKIVLEAGLAEIKAENDIKTDPWPSLEDFDQILTQATTPSPLFIYAKTLLRFVNQKGRPLKRLKLWLERHHSNATQLEDLYATVFQDLDRDEETGKSGALVSEEREVLLHVLGAIVLVAIPLSAAVLADLLDIERDDVDNHVKSLHAVLNVPTTDRAPVEIIHKSFADFLLRDRQKDTNALWVDAPETHAMLARGCIKRMCKGLCKNICKLDHPGTLRHCIKQATIDQFIPVELRYACLYWVHHVVQSKVHIDTFDISSILHEHFLHWLEAMSLLGKLEDGIIAIQDLLGVIQSSSQTSRFVEFLKHAERFALAHIQIIEWAPMQTYGSALVFTPTESKVYQKYWKDQKLACIKAVSGVQAHFDPCLQTLEAHENLISTLAVSGNTIASASYDKQLKLWDSRTGIHRQTFECASALTAIAFLPDGNTLISISLDGDIQTWDMSTGIATLLHTNLVHGAPKSIPYHVDWWNLKTGVHSHTFNDLGQIGHITFSPDGSVVALLPRYGGSVYLLHAATGILKKEFKFDTYASAAAFSPDGSKLAIRGEVSEEKFGAYGSLFTEREDTCDSLNIW
ncbi:hypothetical protein EDB80DRAFT_810279 [Ilyonectria destructans]|nr:hypothetical protein EDB80DRAFT_810279 [Ilyonectria destructans]